MKEENKKVHTPLYPNNVGEWQEAIQKALNLTPEKGKALLRKRVFPFEEVADWIRRSFSTDKGYSPDFVPALVRNLKGLIAWVYGDGAEPYWPGQD